MARTPKTITEVVSGLFDKRAKRFKRASLYIKIVFVSFAAFIASLAQLTNISTPATTNQLVAIGATFLAFLGSLFVLFTDEDASEELAAARRASEELRDLEDELDVLPGYEDAIEQQAHLYQSMTLMRAAIERSVVKDDSVDGTVRVLIELTLRTLPVAMGFAQADRWTVCVYRAEETGTGRDKLRCIAHNRAIKCPIENARSWEEGVGVAGIAYANRQEVVVPNMQAAGLGTVFNIAAGARDYDADRYRSMAAVPIRVDGMAKPWGVVVATNDRYGHFNLNEELGPQNAEGVRLLAGMVALAAVVCKDTPPSPSGTSASAADSSDVN